MFINLKLKMNDELLLNSLKDYYNDDYKSKKITSIINNDIEISLRSIDWFITNYSKKHNIYYNIYEDNNGELTYDKENNKFIKTVNVFQSYKSQLKAYSKKKFDPFCRRKRILFPLKDTEIETTVGQLNFFKWAINNMIIDYIVLNKEKIEDDMNKSLKQMKIDGSLLKKEGIRKQRQELSLSATRGLSRTNIKVVLNFD